MTDDENPFSEKFIATPVQFAERANRSRVQMQLAASGKAIGAEWPRDGVPAAGVEYDIGLQHFFTIRRIEEKSKRALAAQRMPGVVAAHQTAASYGDYALPRPNARAQWIAPCELGEDVGELETGEQLVIARQEVTEDVAHRAGNVHAQRREEARWSPRPQ
jgi:hypothetical protein